MSTATAEPTLKVLQAERSRLHDEHQELQREWQRQRHIVDPGLGDRPPAGPAGIWRARAEVTRLENAIAGLIESLATVDEQITIAVAAERHRLRPKHVKKIRMAVRRAHEATVAAAEAHEELRDIQAAANRELGSSVADSLWYGELCAGSSGHETWVDRWTRIIQPWL